jgi:sulfite reductase (ferredoxin)
MTATTNPSRNHWKESLKDLLGDEHAKGVDDFETEILLKKQGKIEDKVFAERRLRRGAYGQRYDNGHRHNGREDCKIPFPSTELTKGPDTAWDAPGMLRIKLPYGGLNPKQMEVLADITEEYSDDILHVTTRQDFQIHFVNIEDMPSIFRRLASVNITTQEACGNSIRNITACPFGGTCKDEAFDTTPYAHAAFEFLLGHPDCQSFGRKFKIAFSGCGGSSCGLAQMHDLGLVAQIKNENGKDVKGFKVVVGGGLGAIPMQAKVFYEFMPANDLLKLCQAMARVFARHGEKANRNRARLKFLVNDWGIEKFRDLVAEELKILPHDDRWTGYLDKLLADAKAPELNKEPAVINADSLNSDTEYGAWLKHNVREQKQECYYVATLTLPLGDLTPSQMRSLADIGNRYAEGRFRTTVDQNLVLRWVRKVDLPALYQDLKKINLATGDFETIRAITACPGTDTCKLGVSASRGLAGELRKQLDNNQMNLPASANDLNIKISGCYNSCGQHHIADIGFYGVSRKSGDYMVPFFQLVLGGQMEENAGQYGLAMMAIPSKAVPQTIERLTGHYDKNRKKNESFQSFIQRLGKLEVKKLLQDLSKIPTYDENPSYYTDWGDVRIYTKKDIGIGECAGEIVSGVDFAMASADREIFAAQVALDDNNLEEAYKQAFQSMLTAATGLIKEFDQDAKEDATNIRTEFQTRLLDTKLFQDRFIGDKFAKYFLLAPEPGSTKLDHDGTHHFIEQAQLFIEACHSYLVKENL